MLDGRASHEVALAEEIALTEAYLEVEKARLGRRLQLSWQVGDGVLGAQVPALLLQPLVENAIRHGIGPRTQGGRLQLCVERVGERLRLQLRNDGVAEGATTQSSRPAIGLNNVRERLARLYGAAHAFDFDLAPNGDCRVEISLPFRATAVA